MEGYRIPLFPLRELGSHLHHGYGFRWPPYNAGRGSCSRIVGDPDIERQLSALELMNAATIACESVAEIMVQ